MNIIIDLIQINYYLFHFIIYHFFYSINQIHMINKPTKKLY